MLLSLHSICRNYLAWNYGGADDVKCTAGTVGKPFIVSIGLDVTLPLVRERDRGKLLDVKNLYVYVKSIVEWLITVHLQQSSRNGKAGYHACQELRSSWQSNGPLGC